MDDALIEKFKNLKSSELDSLTPEEKNELTMRLNDNIQFNQTEKYFKLVDSKRYSGKSIIDIISKVKQSIRPEKYHNDRAINLDEKALKEHMINFYTEYFPERADEVKSILDGTHPLFIDREGNSHVYFERAKKGVNQTSSVGSSGDDNYLDFYVYLHDSIDDLRTTAHELAHALSAHHQQRVINARAGKKIDHHKKNFERDCVGEIESTIVEQLFNRYLKSEGLYTKDDLINYRRGYEHYISSIIDQIMEERDALNDIDFPLSTHDLEEYVAKLIGSKKWKEINRLRNMIIDPGHNCSYRFRYVVGLIVADQWIKKYAKSNELEREIMLGDFEEHLMKTDILNLDDACMELLGKNFGQIAKDYIRDLQTKKEQTHKEEL